MQGYKITKESVHQGTIICNNNGFSFKDDSKKEFLDFIEESLRSGIEYLKENKTENGYEMQKLVFHEITNETISGFISFLMQKGFEANKFDETIDAYLENLISCLSEKNKNEVKAKLKGVELSYLEKTFLIDQLEEKFESVIK